MTNAEKLEAVRRGERGSYNFSFARSANERAEAFRHILREAHEIAVERGYFCRPADFDEHADSTNGALLVTIETGAEPSAAPQEEKTL